MIHPSQTQGRCGKNAAFTLIELLVVILIIATLAALVVPALSNSINSANKTAAKNQAVQIATAITAYETEYGRLPPFTSSNLTATNIGMLLAGDTGNNPRGINFIELSGWKSRKGGTNTSGDLCDPFSNTNVYQVAIDTNYTNSILVPADATNTSFTNITKHIGVWTIPTIGGKKVLINSWD
jgi:prepilin-type N-terminal cleavage/methylation domain-containing protein